jgi:hypothetical protein
MADIAQNFRRALAMVGIVIRSSADEADTASPTITSGSGVPSAAEPNGSLYMRGEGTLYRRIAGAWVAGESTAAAATGVTAAGAATGATAQASTAVAADPAGTAPAFTGAAPTKGVSEAGILTGTGFATAGQVITTTENETMSVDQYKGCWFITASQAPCVIVSNTAVSGAPGVFTVIGLAPTTNAEAWRVLTAPTPAGTVASHTHTVGAITVTNPTHTHTAGAITITDPTHAH